MKFLAKSLRPVRPPHDAPTFSHSGVVSGEFSSKKEERRRNREIEKIVETELTKELSSGAQKAIAK